MTESCPNTDQLARHARGAVSELMSIAIQRHIEQCPVCATYVATVNDGFDRLLAALPDTARQSLIGPVSSAGAAPGSLQNTVSSAVPGASAPLVDIPPFVEPEADSRPQPRPTAPFMPRVASRFVVLLIVAAVAGACIPWLLEFVRGAAGLSGRAAGGAASTANPLTPGSRQVLEQRCLARLFGSDQSAFDAALQTAREAGVQASTLRLYMGWRQLLSTDLDGAWNVATTCKSDPAQRESAELLGNCITALRAITSGDWTALRIALQKAAKSPATLPMDRRVVRFVQVADHVASGRHAAAAAALNAAIGESTPGAMHELMTLLRGINAWRWAASDSTVSVADRRRLLIQAELDLRTSRLPWSTSPAVAAALQDIQRRLQ